MDDALAMAIGQRLRDLVDDLHHLVEAGLLLVQEGQEVHALDVFHHQVMHAVLLAHLEDADHVRMVHLGHGPGLGLETFHEALLQHGSEQDLDGHQAIQIGLMGLEHHRHAAPAQLGEDDVFPRPPADLDVEQGCRRRPGDYAASSRRADAGSARTEGLERRRRGAWRGRRGAWKAEACPAGHLTSSSAACRKMRFKPSPLR